MLRHKFTPTQVTQISDCVKKFQIFEFTKTDMRIMLKKEITDFLSHFNIPFGFDLYGIIYTSQFNIYNFKIQKFTNMIEWQVYSIYYKRYMSLTHYHLFLFIRKMFRENFDNYRCFRDYIERIFFIEVTNTILFILNAYDIKYTVASFVDWYPYIEFNKFNKTLNIENKKEIYLTYNNYKQFTIFNFYVGYYYWDLYDIRNNMLPLYELLKWQILNKYFMEYMLLISEILDIEDIRRLILMLLYRFFSNQDNICW